ncbi:PepSY domain-containing protein [Streptomyces sp. NPDC000410]|uniref:PepSY domain-containing protein n=1 Tax=Streptomyces sp. NPDC000410 TaxID=3154254 RepID=UPI0033345BD2
MKRKFVISTIAAAVLVGGGTATAFAVVPDGTAKVTTAPSAAPKAPEAPEVTIEEAADAALRAVPGTVTSAELDEAGWEVEVRGKDGKEHELRVDAKTAKVTPDADADAEAEAEDASDDD